MLKRFWAWLNEPFPANDPRPAPIRWPGASAENPFSGERINVIADPPLELSFIVATLQTGTVIRGVLAERGSNALILKSPAVANIDQSGNVTWTPIDGDAVIPVENLDYYQSGIDAAIFGVLPT